MINIPSEVLIVNALYAKQTDFIDYDELSEYKEILYKTLIKKEKYILFNEPETFYPNAKRLEESVYESGDNLFIKLKDGIFSFYGVSLDEEYINSVNSIYDEDVIKLINKSRNKFAKAKTKKLINKVEV